MRLCREQGCLSFDLGRKYKPLLAQSKQRDPNGKRAKAEIFHSRLSSIKKRIKVAQKTENQELERASLEELERLEALRPSVSSHCQSCACISAETSHLLAQLTSGKRRPIRGQPAATAGSGSIGAAGSSANREAQASQPLARGSVTPGIPPTARRSLSDQDLGL